MKSSQNGQPLRLGSAVGISPECLERYRELHANPWPEVTRLTQESNIRNYSIFFLPSHNLAFSYSEYIGQNRAADREKMASHPIMQEWWAQCRPCQVPLVSQSGGRRWSDLETIFFQE